MMTIQVHLPPVLRRAAAGLLLTAAAFGTGATGAHAQDKLSVVISSASLEPGTSTLSSIPQALGFWEDEGLEVEIKSAKGSSLGAQMVITGAADVVHAGTSVGLMQPVAQGADLVAFYNMIIHNFQMPAVPEDSPIQTLADLKGKKLGVVGLATATIPIVKAVLEDAGLDPENDVTFVEVGYGGQAAAALWMTKQVDALAMYDSVYAAIENVDPEQYKLRILTSPLSDRISFQTALTTTRKTLEEKRDLLVKLARGNAKATIFALENPEAAVRIHWEKYPEQKPTNVDEEAALEQSVHALLARINHMRIDTMAVPRDQWGYMHEVDVTTYLDMLKKLGDVDASVEADALYTNALIDEINNFDPEEIKALARDYKVAE